MGEDDTNLFSRIIIVFWYFQDQVDVELFYEQHTGHSEV